MVHLVLLQAPANVVDQLRAASDGFFVIAQGQYIVGANADATAMRNWLRTLGASRVAVLPLQGDWATWSRKDLSDWLQSAANIF